MIKVYVDGLAEPKNPGIASYGYVIYKNGRKIYEEFGGLGEQTNNYAEYMALLKALEKLIALEMFDEKIVIKTDSLLVANQLNGRYKVRSYNLFSIYMRIMKLMSRFQDIRVDWIPREENKEADTLSRKGYVKYIEENPEVLKKYERYMATPRQMKLLRELGLEINKYMSRREASRAIKKHIKKRRR